MTGFVKLYGTILTSSIWLEDHATLRVWIAMLALADRNGVVGASVGGLAHTSRVTKEECQKALDLFLAPDDDSRTPDNDGRRIEKVAGGWKILNHQLYRDLRTEDQVKEAERKARWRAGKSDDRTERDSPESPNDVSVRSEEIQTEAEAYAEAEAVASPSTHPPAIAAFLENLPENQNDRHWLGIIEGWKQGVGLAGMKAATDEDIATGLTDYLAQNDREFSVIHVRSFISRQVRSRLKAEARPNGKPPDQAPALWALIKSHRLHLFTSDSDRDVELGAMVEDREITNPEEFKTMLKKLDLKVLARAGTDAIAVSHIASRLNGQNQAVA